MRTPLLAWAALLPVLLATLPAQTHAQTPALTTGLRSACGLQHLDGELWGVGPTYKVAFRRDGVEFTPALGERAPHNYPLHLRTLGVERGGATWPAAATAPEADALQARYRHPQFVERYDVAADGVHQSFVFDSLPEGDGDLVVHLAVQTELPLAPPRGDGVRFELPELGGVQIGGVTGIDARGRTTPGTIAFDGAELTLRLPAAFVAHAALPLVLDPVIGATFPVAASLADYEDPELAAPYSAAGTYLCAFTFALSATDHDIRAIRIGTTGTITGSLFAITTGTGNDVNPTVGSVALRSAFVIVYQRGGDLFARSILNGTTVSSEYTAASGSDSQVEPDLASEITNLASYGVLVFRNATAMSIQCATVTVFSSGLVAVSAPLTVATGSITNVLSRPRISHSGGDTGRNLIAYTRTVLGGASKPHGVLIDRNVNVLATAQLSTTANDEDNVDVDGNGRTWFVVFESEATIGSGNNDIHGVSVTFDPAQNTIGTTAPVRVSSPLTLTTDETEPTVACRRNGSCLVGYRSIAGTDSSVYVISIDLYSCAFCDGPWLTGSSSDDEGNPTAATHPWIDDNGLALWERTPVGSTNSDLYGVVWDAADGVLATPLGGQGCGVPLEATAGCARVGALQLEARVFGTDGPSVSVFVLSAVTSWLTCGSCRLFANPFDGIAVYPVAGSDGYASTTLVVPLQPALRGTTVYSQWLVNNPAGACSYLQADFSNALAITIE